MTLLRIVVLTCAWFGIAATGPVAAADARPKTGGTFIIGIEGEPATATAHLATDTAAIMSAVNVFNGLISLDFKFEPRPDLADSWEISKDGLTYTFELNKKATWHDGRPVTAADVEFTFNEILAKVHPRAGSWMNNIESTRATGPHTVVIKLKTPYAPFMTVLGTVLSSGTLIMPKHIYQGTDPKTNPANQQPIGSGPFKFVKWVKGQYIELARNDRYFRPGRPYLDRVIVQFLPDAAARMLAFERGEVDFLHWYIVPYEQVARLRKDARFQIVENGGEGAATNAYLLMNLRNPYLKDVRVRRAIAHAINRDEIIEKAVFKEGKVARGFVNSGVPWAFTDKFDLYRKPDLKKADALLEEAGFKRGPDGKRFALRVAWASGRDYEGRSAELIRDYLRQIGIELKVETMDRATFIDKVFKNWDFDLANQLFTTGPDPTVSVTPRFHSNQIKRVAFVNAMGYSNKELDAVFDSEFKEQNRAKRAEMWRKAQQILWNDLPALPLFEVPVINLVSAKFKDVITTPFGYIESRELAHQVK